MIINPGLSIAFCVLLVACFTIGGNLGIADSVFPEEIWENVSFPQPD